MATLALDDEYVDDMQRRQWDTEAVAESLVIDSVLEVRNEGEWGGGWWKGITVGGVISLIVLHSFHPPCRPARKAWINALGCATRPPGVLLRAPLPTLHEVTRAAPYYGLHNAWSHGSP